MSDRMTAIYLPSLRRGAGRAEYGWLEPSEMIAIIRRSAEAQKAEAEAILAADDADFQVETYIGVHAQRQREIIQAARATLARVRGTDGGGSDA
ncbi:hypothetical protein [Synechococcus phage Ssp-JY40]